MLYEKLNKNKHQIVMYLLFYMLFFLYYWLKNLPGNWGIKINYFVLFVDLLNVKVYSTVVYFFWVPPQFFFFIICQTHRLHKGDFFKKKSSGSSMGLCMVHRVLCTRWIKEINCHKAMHSHIKRTLHICYCNTNLLHFWSFALRCISYALENLMLIPGYLFSS